MACWLMKSEPDAKYFDPKSNPDEPRWCLVDIAFVRKLARPLTLTELKAQSGLDGLILTRKGSRLSIMPVDRRHWDRILSLE